MYFEVSGAGRHEITLVTRKANVLVLGGFVLLQVVGERGDIITLVTKILNP